MMRKVKFFPVMKGKNIVFEIMSTIAGIAKIPAYTSPFVMSFIMVKTIPWQGKGRKGLQNNVKSRGRLGRPRGLTTAIYRFTKIYFW